MDWILIYFAIKYKGYFKEIYEAITSKEFVPLEEINKIKVMLETKEIQAITIIDEDYPESLKHIDKPPFVLFYKGNKDLLKKNAILLTGDFSNELIDKFIDSSCQEISKNNILITNYFKGLDQKIVEKVSKYNKPMIFVSADGIDSKFFPEDVNTLFNNKDYLIISEAPGDKCNINKSRLVSRNRITVGLSSFIILASSYKDSGIMNLVSFALEQNKDVFCFPGLQVSNDGNNALINEGAGLVTSIKDIC